jgi:hypothetical protein
MKELLEKLIGLIPAYFGDLLPLISGPKSFIAKRISGDEPAMQKALIFLAVSFLIGWALKTPWLRGDPFLELATDGAFVLIYVLAYGGALYLAWRIAGGRAEIQKFLTIHFYYSGILGFIQTILALGMMGTIRAADPVLYKEIYDVAYSGNMVLFAINNSERLIASPGYRFSLLVQFVGFGAMLTWIFVGWGAYRELNQLSKVRSFMAGLLFFVFCIPVEALTFLIANALIK